MLRISIAITLALLGASPASARDFCNYPGDDWVLTKPGKTSDQMAHDYAECLMSPMAPPMMDAKGNVTKDCRYVYTNDRFVVACMGLKGYVLAPPQTAQQNSPRPDR